MKIKIAFILFFVIANNVNAAPVNNYFLRSDTVPMDPKLTHGQLSNGFSYYLMNNGDPKDKIEIGFIVKAGFGVEQPDQTEVSHVIEHAAFGKTKNFSNVNTFLKEKGLIFGVDFNACTGKKSTGYRITLPSSDQGLLSSCIRIVRDWCSDIILDSETIEIEKGSVLTEHGNPKETSIQTPSNIYTAISGDNSPAEIVRKIKSFQHTAIKNYYQDWYRPDLQGIIIVGNIDAQQVKKEIEQLFGDLTMPAVVKQLTAKFKPSIRSSWNTFYDQPGFVQTVMTKIYWQKTDNIITASDYKKILMIDLYNNMAKRRFDNLPYDRLIISIGQQYTRNKLPEIGVDDFDTNVTLYGKMTSADIEKNIKYILTEEERINRYGFTVNELNAAKQQVLKGKKLLNKDSSEESANEQIAENCASLFMGLSALPSQDYLKQNIPVWLTSISLNDIQILQKQWRDSDSTIILSTSGDKNETSLPDSAEFYKWVKSISQLKLEKYTPTPGKSIISKEELAKIRSTKPVKKEIFAEIGTKVITLSNGAKIILKPMKASLKADIMMDAFKPIGALEHKDFNYYNVLMATQLVLRSGVGNLKKQELDFSLRNSKTEVRPGIDKKQVRILAETKTEDLELMFQLLYQYLASPKIDKGISRNFSTPDFGSVNQAYYNSLMQKFTNESIPDQKIYDKTDSFDIDQLLLIYKNYFSDLRGFTFIFTGNFEVDHIESLIEKYIGSLPAYNGKSEVRNMYMQVLPNDSNVSGQYRITDKSKNEKSHLVYFLGNTNYSLKNRLKRYIVKNILNQLLYERLREKMGQVYFVSVDDAQLAVDKSRLTIYFSSSTGNIDTLADAAWEEVNKVYNGLFSEATFKTAVEQVKTLNDPKSDSHSFWQNYFIDQAIYDMPLNAIENYKAELEKIDYKSIVEFAHSYLKQNNPQKIELK